MKRWLPFLIIAALTLVLAFIVRDFVREVLVTPLVYVGWLGWLMVTNLPDWVFWLLLLLVGAILATASMRGPKPAAPERRSEAATEQGPVHRWQRMFEQAAASPTGRQRLARELGRVLWTDRHPDRPYNLAEFEARGAATFGPLPRELHDFFLAGLQRTPAHPAGRLRVVRRPQPDGLPVDDVVAYLEAMLAPDDRSSSPRMEERP